MKKNRLLIIVFEHLDPAMPEATLLFFSAMEDNTSFLFAYARRVRFCQFLLEEFSLV